MRRLLSQSQFVDVVTRDGLRRRGTASRHRRCRPIRTTAQATAGTVIQIWVRVLFGFAGQHGIAGCHDRGLHDNFARAIGVGIHGHDAYGNQSSAR